MASPTILQTVVMTAILTHLVTAMPTIMPTSPSTCNGCPVDCYFGPGEQKCTANCKGKGLSSVPDECSYVGNLLISDNSIHRITRTTFASFNSLELLRMKDNSISSIGPESFAQTQLETIDLSSNDLQSLDKDVFLNVTSLTHVIVVDNHIESIQEYNLPNLTLLDMSRNQINDIRRSSFANMTNIRYLYLSHNLIRELKNNLLGEKMKHLITLDLSENNINSINKRAFYFLRNLKELDLSGNAITDEGFPDTQEPLFEMQMHLQILSISHNRISSLKRYMLLGLGKNLTELSADNNQISTIEADIFIQIQFKNLTKLNLKNNNLGSNFSKEFVPLLEAQPTPKIELEGNPLCEEYQTVFSGQYNRHIFCSAEEMSSYPEPGENIATTNLSPSKGFSEQTGERVQLDTLKLVCIVSAGILVLLLIILVAVWIKSNNRRTGNYTTCVTNRGYQYPSDRVSEPESAPPPIPTREPLLNEEYANTTMSSYITPNDHSSTNGHPPAIHRCPPSTSRNSPSSHRHCPSSSRHSPSSHRHCPSSSRHSQPSNRHCPSSSRHSQSSNRHSFRRSILKRLPSIPHKHSSNEPIVVIGTTGTSTGTTRIEGLPLCKSVNKNNVSQCHKKPPQSSAKRAEDGVYMIREETEDGKPKNTTMASYRSVQD